MIKGILFTEFLIDDFKPIMKNQKAIPLRICIVRCHCYMLVYFLTLFDHSAKNDGLPKTIANTCITNLCLMEFSTLIN